jgi:hypothetical protein
VNSEIVTRRPVASIPWKAPPVGTGDREVHRDIVAVDNEVPYLPMPVRPPRKVRVLTDILLEYFGASKSRAAA